MATQRTPYDEMIVPLERNPGREQMRALRILSANREGYLRAKAEDAPLLEAAKAFLDAWKGDNEERLAALYARNIGAQIQLAVDQAIK